MRIHSVELLRNVVRGGDFIQFKVDEKTIVQDGRPTDHGAPIAASPHDPATGRSAHERLPKFAPVLLVQFNVMLLRGGLDAFPGGIAFSVGHPLHLPEAGDCVADVSSVMDRFFAFLGESEVVIGDLIAASFSDFGHDG
jgi:hypothetical protein